jgi:hypothetical protein
MTHDRYREWIQRELDDDLSPEELELLDRHVATCADCRLEREQYQSLALGLSKLSKVMPERSFAAAMMSELEPFVRAGKPRRRFGGPWVQIASFAAVIVLAIGLAGVWNDSPLGESEPHAGPVAQRDSQTEEATLKTEETKQEPQTEVAQNVSPTLPADPKKMNPEQSGQTKPTQQAPQESSSQQAANPAPANRQTANVPDSSGSQQVPSNSIPGTPDTQAVAITGGTEHQVASDGEDAPAEEGDIAITGLQPRQEYGITSSSRTADETHLIGNAPDIPTLNEDAQAAVKRGDSSLQWATDPFEVVRRHLRDLGFAANASVASTNDVDRILVSQGGYRYEVKLVQPYESGAGGIWRPVSIARAIKPGQASEAENAVLEYFAKSMDSGAILEHGDLYVLNEFDGSKLSVRTTVDKMDAEGRLQSVQVTYDFTLRQEANGSYAIVGEPVQR